MSEQNQNNNTETKQEPLTLEFKSFEDFNPTMASRIITTKKISEKLNARLKPVFQDYFGCNIEPYPNGQGLSVSLLFTQIPGNGVSPVKPIAFESIESKKGVGNVADRSRAIHNEYRNGRKFDISEDAKSALKILFANPDKVDWRKATTETSVRSGFGMNSFNVIIGIDFNRVCEIIFGSKEVKEEGTSKVTDKIYYMPFICCPAITGAMNGVVAKPTNWVINLSTMSESSAKEMMEETGMIGGFTGVNCVQA